MTSRPLLMSGSMVRAILAGEKSQTRRTIDLSRVSGEPIVPPGCVFDLCAPGIRQHYGYVMPQGEQAMWRVQRLCNDTCRHADDAAFYEVPPRAPLLGTGPYDGRHSVAWGPLPFWPGLRLWVRETFSEFQTEDGEYERWCYAADCVGKSDEDARPWGHIGSKYEGRVLPWRPSIFMPRAASRITLLVESVRIERLQDISEADARAEGVKAADAAVVFQQVGLSAAGLPRAREASELSNTARGAFACLWDKINGDRAPWSSDPFVWVVTFRRIEA